MKRKIIILTIIYITIGIFINSCGLLKYDAMICDITFAALNSTHQENQQPDRFSDKIGFEIWSIAKSPTCYLPRIQLFNSAYATTKCAEFQNRLLQSTYELSLDRSIVLNNDTIKANTNLLAIPDILGLTDIEINEDCKFVTSTIIFRQELIDRMTFVLGEYVVNFNCSTSDNKTFTKTRRVIFNE